jgi:tetratricopeptide (TPR) repeat protein
LRLQEYQDAITAYNKYIGFDSSLAVSYYNRAVAKDNLNDYQGAVADLVKAIELNPDPYYVSYLSYIYFRHNDIDAAIDITKYGIEKDSARAFLYSNLGRFYLEKGDYDNAEMNFSKCVEIDNENYQTALNISELYFNKNDKINSKKYLDQAKKLEPRLNNGLDGIEEIEKEQPGQCKYSDERKETLQKMFEELK